MPLFDFFPFKLPPAVNFDNSFYQTALDLYHTYCRDKKEELTLPDSLFVKLGVQRCLEPLDSGRHFLQNLADNGQKLPRSTFFDALHDARRLRVLAEVSNRLAEKATQIKGDTDWLAELPGLKDRPVWAVDGHQIAHACHALKDGKNAHVPSGSLYGLDLHTGIMRALCPHQGNGRRTSEIKALKQVLSGFFGGKGSGRPIVVADMGFVDNTFWPMRRMLDKHAPDLITRQKENMRTLTAIALPFDRETRLNQGVQNYELVAYSSGLQMTRVIHRDPETDTELIFLCTDITLAPGIIALLYRLRWKIEKTYHTFKSKLHERKAWATGLIAQEIQNHFMALTHNLLTLFLYKLDKDHGIKEEKLLKKHDEKKEKRKEKNIPEPLFYDIARKALQLSHQYIRCVRNTMGKRKPWHEVLDIFKERLQCYL